jgi:AcrR family transcriptional regulator
MNKYRETMPRPSNDSRPVPTARARATREKVLASARNCVRELGPLGATSNEIARRAGVSWGVIQYHFGTREGILLAMIEDGFIGLLDTLDSFEAPDRGTSRDQLALVVDAIWSYCIQPDYLLYMDTLRLLRRDPSSAAIVDSMLQASQRQLERRMTRLLRGVTSSEATLRTVRSLVFATMRGLALRNSFDAHASSSLAERRLLVRALGLAIEDRDGARSR